MSRTILKQVRRYARRIFLNPVNNRTRKHVISKFASKYKLNYVGFIDQSNINYSVIRGFSVSSSHEDNHYCIGQVSDYDVALVDRVDAIWKPDGSTVQHNWLVMSFNLKTKSDIPHFFIHARNHESDAFRTLFSTHPSIKEADLGTFENYSPEFTSRFNIYTQPSLVIQIEKLLPNSAARVIGAHFWPLSAEHQDHVIYIYADNKQVTANLLDTMLKCGLWLAKHLDHQSEVV